MILSRAGSAPQEVALDDGTRRRSWAELDDRVRRIAHWLRDGLALAPASHVAVLMGNRAGAGGVIGVVFRGRRYDTGDKLDYLKAIVQLASEREDLGDQFRPWLQEFVAGF